MSSRSIREWPPTVVGTVSEIAMVGVGSNRVVTASRLTGDNHPGNTDKLKLTVWDVDSSPGEYKIVSRGEHWDPTATIEKVAITVAGDYVVTAVRDKTSNDLRIDSFRLRDNSKGEVDIDQVATKSDHAHFVNEIAISRAGAGVGGAVIVMTALRNKAGSLVVATWGLESGFGSPDIGQLNEKQRGEASQIAIAESSRGAVTAFKNGEGNLELIPWDVESTGKITPMEKTEGGAVSQVAIAALGDDHFVVAVRNESEHLELNTYKVLNGGSLKRLQKHGTDGGWINDHRVAVVSVGPYRDNNQTFAPYQAACASVDGSGNLNMSLFDVNSEGKPTENGTKSLLPASHVTIAVGEPTTKTGDFGAIKNFDHLITAVRDKDGKLSLMYWEAFY